MPSRRAVLGADDRELPRGGRAQDLALLRDVRRRRGSRAAARQRPARARADHRAPHVADQHRRWRCSRRSRRTISASSTPTSWSTRIDATLTTVEGLERFEGHLLNWYDTRTLAPLPPAYVSTVDSGNLAGALLTLSVALSQLAGRADGPALRARSRPAPSRCSTAMNFRFLYDPQRQLFAIGYRLADPDGPGRLDASYYDLLASEARLASFLAIAKGDVPESHWFHLGRADHQRPRRAGAAVVERARCSST